MKFGKMLVGGLCAVAATTVGTAVGGAMATVGTTVGTVAGAAGLSSIATVTGTTAGATAVGAITTSVAVGGANAASGAMKMKKASNIVEVSQQEEKEARTKFDAIESDTNKELEKLGQLKIEIWNGFERYKKAYDQIKNIEEWEKLELDGELKLDKNILDDIQLLAVSAKEIIKDGVISITSGQIMGVATSTGITSVATASTGTAIASLHGVAATNASMAALGGGSLASGGLGMAGGAIVSNFLLAAPAVAVGGMFINKHGNKSLKSAKESQEQVNEYVFNLNEASTELLKLKKLCQKLTGRLKVYRRYYEKHTDWLEELVGKEIDFKKYTIEEKKKLYLSGQIVTILKDLTLLRLIDDETKEVETLKVDERINYLDKEYNQAVQKVS